MSAIAARPGLVLGAAPRVELLPREVRAREKARSMRRLSIALIVVLVLAVAGGYVFANSINTTAQADLASAQSEASSILSQKAKYAAVTTAAGQVQAIEQAQTLVGSNDVLWASLIGDIDAILPNATAIEGAKMNAPAPWETQLIPTGPLRQQRVASVTLTLTSLNIISVGEVTRSLAKLPGYADASVDSIGFSNGVYTTVVTMNLDKAVYSGRFTTKEVAK